MRLPHAVPSHPATTAAARESLSGGTFSGDEEREDDRCGQERTDAHGRYDIERPGKFTHNARFPCPLTQTHVKAEDVSFKDCTGER